MAGGSAAPVVEGAHALGVPVAAHDHGLPAVEQAAAAEWTASHRPHPGQPPHYPPAWEAELVG